MFSPISVLRIEGDRVIFKDLNNKDSVRRTGWYSGNTESGCRQPSTDHSAGEMLKDRKFHITNRPKGGGIAIKNDAARRAQARYTGKSTVINIGLCVNVRFYEIEWSVNKNVEKYVNRTSVKPVPGDEISAEKRAALLRALAKGPSGAISEALLAGKWIEGMPLFVLEVQLGTSLGVPSKVRFDGATITEQYKVNGLTISAVDGRVKAVEKQATL